MERSRRLYTLWNWLVPFRAVAEVESLAEASKSLHVASSALSRSVKLLEEQLEVQLFDRTPAGLRLTDAGRELLDAVRLSMRTLDDTIESMKGEELKGTTTVSAPGELYPLLVPMLSELTATHPHLSYSFREVDDMGALTRLRTGQIDVALVGPDAADRELTFRPLPPLERGFFVAQGHPLAENERVDADTIAGVPFAAFFDRSGVARDGFPNQHRRRIAFRDVRGASLVEVIRAGLAMGALPRVLGEALGLVEIRCDAVALEPQRGSIALRNPLEGERSAPAEVVADAIEKGFAALASR